MLGAYIARVYAGGAAPGDRVFEPVERAVYRVAGVDPEREQPWTVYALSVIAFSAVKTRGYEVDVAPTGELALALAAKRHPDLVILDLGLPGGERDTDEVPRRGAGEVLGTDRGSVHTPMAGGAGGTTIGLP